MIIAQSGGSYPINRNGVDATISKSVDDIMAYVTNLGYNSFFLLNTGYIFTNQYYLIFPFDATLVNGDSIYLIDNPTGASIDPTAGARADRVRNYCYNVNNDGNIQQKGSISWSTGTYYGNDYRTYSYQTYEPVFYTSLSYSKIYVNNEDVTPVLYIWTSVPAISGKMGILSLGTILDEFIGNGSAVADQPMSYAGQLPEGANIGNLCSGLISGQSADLIYSGDSYKLYASRGVESGTPLRPYVDLNFCFQPTTGGVYTPFYTYRIYTLINPHFTSGYYLGFIIDEDAQVAALNMIHLHTSGVDNLIDYCTPGASMSESDMSNLYAWIKGSTLPEDWDTTDSIIDDEGDGGGDYHERINNPIPTPGVPYLSAYDSGFLSQYLVTKAQLKSLASFLWSDNFVDNVKKFFGDPRQIIMGISIFPVKPPHDSSASNIKAGGIDTGVSGQKVTTQFKRYDLGYAKIEKTFTNGIFYDYSPYLSAKIYLPFCGEHDLSLNDIMGKTLHLEYTVDHVSGICAAHITITDPNNELPDECHYNFTGQMGVQIPLSSEDFGGFYRAMLSSGAAIGSGIATIATGGMTAPLAIGAGVNAVGNVANMGKDVQFTSGGGSIAGSLGSEYPYITLVEPLVFKDGNQRHYMGYPYYSKKQLKNMSGFTKIMGIHLDGLSCTEIERSAIRDQLAKGIIIQTGDPLPAPDPNRPEGEESLILLHNLSDVDTIGKKFEKDNQGYVEYVELTSKLLYNQDFAAVGLLVSEYNAGYNYAYIPSFGRVYYIDKITAESGGMVSYNLICDASESFWNELKECYALIEANEYQSGAKMLINNNTWFMKQNKRVVTKVFQGGDISDSNGVSCFLRGQYGEECFLITIAGDTDD